MSIDKTFKKNKKISFFTNDRKIQFFMPNSWIKQYKLSDSEIYSQLNQLIDHFDDYWLNGDHEANYSIAYANRGRTFTLPSEDVFIKNANVEGSTIVEIKKTKIDGNDAIELVQENQDGLCARAFYILHNSNLYLFVFHHITDRDNKLQDLFTEDIEDIIKSMVFSEDKDEGKIQEVITEDNVFKIKCPKNWIEQSTRNNPYTNYFLHVSGEIAHFFAYQNKGYNPDPGLYEVIVQAYKDSARSTGATIISSQKTFIDGHEATDITQRNPSGSYSRCIEITMNNVGYYFEFGNLEDVIHPDNKELLFSQEIEDTIKSIRFF
ncbi:MAG: hypothetical protein FWH29_00595 [Methanobrevibacter sp.]|nr:hypothetical protein [Methanobrevibacter sp.]